MDEDEFRRLAEPHRREIQLHCYRMLGSLHDAEDVTQETFLRAWRHLGSFEGRASFRAWLYKIATNACLSARAKRVLPQDSFDALDPSQSPAPPEEVLFLEPYPDALIDETANPEARYEQRESVSLAFVAALQYLPPRQRAVLILRDALGWSAQEVADALECSVASANSALQRARASMRGRVPPERVHAPGEDMERLLEQYVRAWEARDIPALVALLKQDAILSMPPYAAWVRGRGAIGDFFTNVVFPERGRSRLARAGANGQPAFATFEQTPDGEVAVGVMVLTLQGDEVAEITAYPEPAWVDVLVSR